VIDWRMRVLLTGANGYIGLRLLPSLLNEGHQVTLMVRDLARFPYSDFREWVDAGQLDYVEVDALDRSTMEVGEAFDVAYYFLHSMGSGGDFLAREVRCAENFKWWMESVRCKQVVYLGGLSEDAGEQMSQHMLSRQRVAEVLSEGGYALTVLRASIIVGSGSASFEIIRDLTEKLPVMITPKWTATRCQPIAVRNVIYYLLHVVGDERCYDRTFDIGGPEVLTYRGMLEGYAKVRGLSRYAVSVPLLSPKLSSHWLHLITSTTYSLAQSLVSSLHIESVCKDRAIEELIPQKLLSYREAIEMALSRIAQNRVPSVWYDSLSSGAFNNKNVSAIKVPQHGVLYDRRETQCRVDRADVLESVWSLGGDKGWPSMDWAWQVRGAIDRVLGGIGTRRGRRHPSHLHAGDALDFWRVILADQHEGRLILYAEMKLPGEAWLEFTVQEGRFIQTATFRPKGLWGRFYWYATYPFHLVLFPRMCAKLASGW